MTFISNRNLRIRATWFWYFGKKKTQTKTNQIIQSSCIFFLQSILWGLVVVAHPHIRPNHNAYQRFNILCEETEEDLVITIGFANYL